MKTTFIAGSITVLSALGQRPDKAALRAPGLDAMTETTQVLAVGALAPLWFRRSPRKAICRAHNRSARIRSLRGCINQEAPFTLPSGTLTPRFVPYSTRSGNEKTGLISTGIPVVRSERFLQLRRHPVVLGEPGFARGRGRRWLPFPAVPSREPRARRAFARSRSRNGRPRN